MSLFKQLQTRTNITPKAIALQFEGQKLSYEDLALSASLLAKGLSEQGIKKGDVVALMLPNRLEFIQSYFAIQKLGAVVLPINLLLEASEIEYILKDSSAKALIFAKPFYEKIASLSLTKIILTEEAPPEGSLHFMSLFSSQQDLPPLKIQDQEMAALLYTSGTTGKPKGVMLSHRNLLHMSSMLNKAFGLGEGLKSLLVLPLFHIFALSVMHAKIEAGMTIVLQQKFEPAKVLQTLIEEEINIFCGVPTMYAALVHALQDSVLNPPHSLQGCFCGGAPLTLELEKSFEKAFGIKIAEGYGLTEAAGVAAFNLDYDHIKTGSIGLAVPGNQMKVVDEKGQELPQNQVGEIIIKGDNIMMGYLNQPEATAEVLKESWYYTGDLAFQDEDGYFTIVDRKKDMIIVGGENVYPKEVEEVLYQYPGVLEAAVVGIAHETMGEVPKAYVVLAKDQKVSAEDIINFLSKRLAKFKVPRTIEFRKSLPKNATGKILKRELKSPTSH
ncbi:MAG: long-chain fatty acid--CoA ligase [Deltaproteobacteria bacterium]|nr:long-chain fatty acid--CoA ligase [Deltaproteobacteria bacterium]